VTFDCDGPSISFRFCISIGTMMAPRSTIGRMTIQSVLLLVLLLAVQQATARSGWGIVSHGRSRVSVASPLNRFLLEQPLRGGASPDARDKETLDAATASKTEADEPEVVPDLYLPGLLNTHIVRQPGVRTICSFMERFTRFFDSLTILFIHSSCLMFTISLYRLQSRQYPTLPLAFHLPRPRN
jgi:hypothetical protein